MKLEGMQGFGRMDTHCHHSHRLWWNSSRCSRQWGSTRYVIVHHYRDKYSGSLCCSHSVRLVAREPNGLLCSESQAPCKWNPRYLERNTSLGVISFDLFIASHLMIKWKMARRWRSHPRPSVRKRNAPSWSYHWRPHTWWSGPIQTAAHACSPAPPHSGMPPRIHNRRQRKWHLQFKTNRMN